jgi:hypothetical protein
MDISVEMTHESAIPIKEWETFLAQARRAGATGNTAVAEVFAQGTDDVVIAYRIDVAGADKAVPEVVTLPATLVQDLLHVASVVATSDGDVRSLQARAQNVVEDVQNHLLEPVLGPSPYAENDD